jgi:protein TonB
VHSKNYWHSNSCNQKDTLPQFPGGDGEWRKYLERSINRDIPVDDNVQPGCYTIKGSFQVDADGSISDIQLLKNDFPKMSAEIIRVIKNSPKWLPVVKNGKAVTGRGDITYRFSIATE